ncbi:hypothetical protein TNCV_1297661 [Trichonephila clavipes]|nr:hypothetical protein TNCV_1297661 [Trichonephila clavipes]
MTSLQWYWARTHDMPTMIRYLDHWVTAALGNSERHAENCEVDVLLKVSALHLTKEKYLQLENISINGTTKSKLAVCAEIKVLDDRIYHKM